MSDEKRWFQKWRWRLVIIAVVLVLAGAWQHGTFDHVLVNVGLNAKECARNGFGATFCGEELDVYRQRQETAKREAQEASEKIKAEAQEAQTKAQQQAAEIEAKVQRETREDLRRSEEAEGEP